MLRVMAYDRDDTTTWYKVGWRWRFRDEMERNGIRFVDTLPDLVLCCNDKPETDLRDLPTVIEITSDRVSLKPSDVGMIAPAHVKACFRNIMYRDPADYAAPVVLDDHVGYQWIQATKTQATVMQPGDVFPHLIHKLRLALPLYWPPHSGSLQLSASNPDLSSRPTDVQFIGRRLYMQGGQHCWPEEHRSICEREFRAQLSGMQTEWLDYQDKAVLRYIPYIHKLMETKIALSPWGWAAWNIRDYEALMCGCVLIKPECSNLVALPDIYDPWNAAIVYCDPTFSDLRQVVYRVLIDLSMWQERVRMARQLVVDAINPAALIRVWSAELKRAYELK